MSYKTAKEIAEVLGQASPSGDGWKCVCPCHIDDKPSLSLTDTPDGKLLVNCFAGCKYSDIMNHLEGCGLVPTRDVTYEYRDESGNLLYTKVRRPNKQFVILTPDNESVKTKRKVLYGLSSVPKDGSGVVIWVEGEKDVDNLISLGFSAVSAFDGADAKWHEDYLNQLNDCQVVVIPDNDEPGQRFAKKISDKLNCPIIPITYIAALLSSGPAKGYDVSDAIEDGLDRPLLTKVIAEAFSKQEFPHVDTSSPVIEDIVVSLLLQYPELLPEVTSSLLRDDFTYPLNRAIYEKLLREQVDTLELSCAINSPLIDDHLDKLVSIPVVPSRTSEYCRILKDASAKRNLKQIVAEAQYKIDKVDTYELLSYLEKEITRLSIRGESSDEDISLSVKETIQEIEKRVQNKGSLLGKSTFIPQLDKVTSGLQSKDLIIIAGRPGMGKTAFVTNVAQKLALEENSRVLFFSLEMSSEQLITRMLSSVSEIAASKLRTGELTDDELIKIKESADLIAKSNLVIDDQAAIPIRTIISKARRLHRKQPLDLIVVDYLQLVKPNKHSSNGTRDQEVGQISSSLKALSKELNVPVVALSQLNRGLESRQNKRPTAADLRESGSIEQDADLILMLYRDCVYNESADKTEAEIIVVKQRNGPIGVVKTCFNAEKTRFEPYVSSVPDIETLTEELYGRH